MVKINPTINVRRIKAEAAIAAYDEVARARRHWLVIGATITRHRDPTRSEKMKLARAERDYNNAVRMAKVCAQPPNNLRG